MSKLEKAIYILQRMEVRSVDNTGIDSRIGIFVTVYYLFFMLSIPVGRLSLLLWMCLYPIVAAAWQGLSFGRIFRQSLLILPLVILIGIFNPIFDRKLLFYAGNIGITSGWISFFSVVIRGLLAMQSLLILIESNGFLGICRGLTKLGFPKFLTEQLQFIYRYMVVLLEEVLTMRRAREARGYGRKSYPLKLWGTMIGQLFLRAIYRSENIANAMEARCFTGAIPDYVAKSAGVSKRDVLFLVFWCAVIPVLRYYDLSNLLFNHLI